MADDPPTLPRQSSCPTCGQAVEVASSDEGTNYYVGIDAWDASTLRTERDAAVAAATMELRRALQWVADRYEATLAGRSVRDADECLIHARGLVAKETSDAF